MKKIVAMILVFAVLFTGASALAEPSPTPGETDAAPEVTPTPPPAATPAVIGPWELITYKSKSENVVRVQLRLRELCYFNFKPTGNYQTMSVDAAIKFQQKQVDANGQSIMADGSIGEQSKDILFSIAAVRSDITSGIPFGKSLQDTPTVTGSLISWSEVKTLLMPGNTYIVTDYNTGVTFSMVYTGGENHAEMECADSASTAIYLEAFGGEFNYSKRPVVITVGDKDIAASLQGFPHGEDTVAANDMTGHSCLFFDGSLSHVGGLPDVEHLKQIYVAAGRG